ncbi:MAG TPA: ABC transporter permease [Bacillales bacterium]|nr:ABC transporter permease [Bacillales bacterium]
MKLSHSIGTVVTGIAGAIMLAFLVLPMISVYLDMAPGKLWEQLTTPVAVQALQLSVLTTFISLGLILLFGTPLAYFLANREFPGKRVLEVVLQLPIVIPPAVAGVGLLLVFGRYGLIGQWLSAAGIGVAFSTTAVIMAQSFVAAPFYIQGARTAFAGVDPNLVSVSRTLGISPAKTFFRVVFPLALPGLISGAALSWGRALGEFGATIMFAGNLPGKTQTLPLAIYSAMQSDLGVAIAISALLITVGFCLLLLVKLVELWPKRKQKSGKKEGRQRAQMQRPENAS